MVLTLLGARHVHKVKEKWQTKDRWRREVRRRNRAAGWVVVLVIIVVLAIMKAVS